MHLGTWIKRALLGLIAAVAIAWRMAPRPGARP